MKRSLILALAVAAFAAERSASAAATLFFSTIAPPASFPVAGAPAQSITNPTINMNVGDVKTLYMWVNLPDAAQLPANHDIINSLGINIFATTPGKVSGSGTINVANPTHAVGRGSAPRWDTPVNTGTTNANGNLFDNVRPFAVTSAGLDPSVDLDYDTTFTNYYLGSIDIHADAAGTTGIKFAVGNLTMGYAASSADAGVAPQFFFGTGDSSINGASVGAVSSLADATINVTAAPEPASLALLGLGGILLFRKRKHA